MGYRFFEKLKKKYTYAEVGSGMNGLSFVLRN